MVQLLEYFVPLLHFLLLVDVLAEIPLVFHFWRASAIPGRWTWLSSLPQVDLAEEVAELQFPLLAAENLAAV